MIEIIEDVPPGITTMRATGAVTKDEYDTVVVPMLDEAVRTGRHIRCLCQVDSAFHGLTRASDVDALGHTVDTWLETHQRLSGLVLHARLDDALAWAAGASKTGPPPA